MGRGFDFFRFQKSAAMISKEYISESQIGVSNNFGIKKNQGRGAAFNPTSSPNIEWIFILFYLSETGIKIRKFYAAEM